MLYDGSWAPAVFDATAPPELADNYSIPKVPAVKPPILTRPATAAARAG